MPTADDYREAAEDVLALAETLVGDGPLSDCAFLETMARMDRIIEHEDKCGHCAQRRIYAETARDLLVEGEVLDGIAKWGAESERRWHASKYFKLYQREKAAGRDPRAAFKKRGWEM